MEVVFEQLKALVDRLTKDDWNNIVVAYEPVWAIGTGKTASPGQAQEVHQAIRKWFSDVVSSEIASKLRIVYGGKQFRFLWNLCPPSLRKTRTCSAVLHSPSTYGGAL